MPKEERIIAGIPVASYFPERWQARRDFLSERAKIGEEDDGRYTNQYGDYGQYGLIQNRKHEYYFKFISGFGNIREGSFDLVGLESFFAKRFNKILETKNGKVPAIAIDIGGMQGRSWLRLAKRFEKEVRASQAVFVVTNLFYKPEEECMYYGDSELKELFEGAGDLVYFLNCQVGDLRRRTLELPNGQAVSTKGNVDIINEQFSLHNWGYIPEVEIIQAASLLSPYGMYTIQTGKYLTDELYGLPSGANLARETGIALAHQEMCRRFGLNRVTHVEAGDFQGQEIDISRNFYLFKKASSPLIEVNQQPK